MLLEIRHDKEGREEQDSSGPSFTYRGTWSSGTANGERGSGDFTVGVGAVSSVRVVGISIV
jgi:hypothetical protein